MPTPITFGAMSARSFGFGLSRGGADGTFGVFAVALTSQASSKYVFASDTSATGANWAQSPNAAVVSAAGNSVVGIYMVGFRAGLGNVGQTNKYTWANNTVAAGGNLATQTGTSSAVSGNATTAVFFQGTAVDLYTYANDTSASGTAGSISAIQASGNATDVIAASASGTTKKYNYSGNSWATATTLVYATSGNLRFGTGGNSTTGLFMDSYGYGGCCACYYGFQWTRYTWAGATVAGTQNLSGANTYLGSVASISTKLVIDTGVSNPAYKYLYATNTLSAGGNFSTTPGQYCGGASNGNAGVTM